MSTFVLIHGAWHGAWCWHKLMPLLRDQGHVVIAPDLPGLGIDRTPVASISMQAYVDRVCEALMLSNEPAYLVGHSMGGGVITQAAEVMPQQVKMLVYLAAFLPRNGHSLLAELQADASAILSSSLMPGTDQSCAMVRQEVVGELFYGDCSAADLALAQTLLVAQAMAPLSTPIHTTAERWGRVPRVYIECSHDRALSLWAQRAMLAHLPCQQVYTMPTSHSPFLSAPATLAECLLSLL